MAHHFASELPYTIRPAISDRLSVSFFGLSYFPFALLCFSLGGLSTCIDNPLLKEAFSFITYGLAEDLKELLWCSKQT